MDFSTSVFMYPLHTVRPYPRFSALHAACCFTRPQALKTFERCEATLERCVAALNS